MNYSADEHEYMELKAQFAVEAEEERKRIREQQDKLERLMEKDPEMGSEDFVSEVKGLFHKLQDALREADRREKHDPERYYWHPEEVANRKWCEQNKVN